GRGNRRISRRSCFLHRLCRLSHGEQRRCLGAFQRSACGNSQSKSRGADIVGQFHKRHNVLVAKRQPKTDQTAAKVLNGLGHNRGTILRLLHQSLQGFNGVRTLNEVTGHRIPPFVGSANLWSPGEDPTIHGLLYQGRGEFYVECEIPCVAIARASICTHWRSSFGSTTSTLDPKPSTMNRASASASNSTRTVVQSEECSGCLLPDTIVLAYHPCNFRAAPAVSDNVAA